MPAFAFALALTAAFVHALWNVLLARARDPQAATAVALLVAVVVFAPVAALTWDVHPGVWPFLVVSSCLQLLYFVLLAAAYRRAPLSVVYPMARGAAPVLVLLIGVVALGKSSSAGQVVGVLLVCAGILLVRGFRAGDANGMAFGLAIATTIAAYTLVDKHGITHAGPIPYLELTMVIPSLTYGAAMLRTKGAPALRAEFGPSTIAAGLATFGAYALVLAALERASAASVAAVRETSVVIATALAAVVLKEPVGASRFAGAIVVAGGVALISLS